MLVEALNDCVWCGVLCDYRNLSIRLQSNMMWTGQLRTDPSQNGIDKLAPEPMQVTYPSPFATNLTYIEVRDIDSQGVTVERVS